MSHKKPADKTKPATILGHYGYATLGEGRVPLWLAELPDGSRLVLADVEGRGELAIGSTQRVAYVQGRWVWSHNLSESVRRQQGPAAV